MEKLIKSNISKKANYEQDIFFECNKIENPLFSVLMTTHDRLKQTLFTIKTIENQKQFQSQVQIIIVDDSTEPSEIITPNKYEFKVYVTYLHIKNKNWLCPSKNFNIGFSHVKGQILIIQPAEVCHIGTTLNMIKQSISPNNYLIFNVRYSPSQQHNEILHDIYDNNKSYHPISKWEWYQHHKKNKRNLHFLVATNTQHFRKNGNFIFDDWLTFGANFDDNMLFWYVQNVLKLQLKHITNEQIIGIHQWHPRTISEFYNMRNIYAYNNFLTWQLKKNMFQNTGIYVTRNTPAKRFFLYGKYFLFSAKHIFQNNQLKIFGNNLKFYSIEPFNIGLKNGYKLSCEENGLQLPKTITIQYFFKVDFDNTFTISLRHNNNTLSTIKIKSNLKQLKFDMTFPRKMRYNRNNNIFIQSESTKQNVFYIDH